MKKHLLGTTALVAAGMLTMAGGALAQGAKPISVSVNGYHGQFIGYISQDDGPSGEVNDFDQQKDAEIIFNGRTTLDNGITVGFQVQLEASTEGDQIDESFMFIEGGFGRIELGSINNVAYRMHYKAPDVFTRGWLNEGNIYDWIINPTSSPLFNSQINMTSLRFFDNDSEKINYYTPRFAGFQVGVSYIPDSSQDRNAPVNKNVSSIATGAGAGYQRGFAAGANFVRSFGSFDVAASVGYMTWNVPDNVDAPDPDAYSAGLVLGFGGFKVGASWSKIEDGRVAGAGTAADSSFPNLRRLDGTSWDVGASYTFGPAAVSITYFTGENDSRLLTATTGGDDEFSAVALAGNYKLGPGVNLDAVLFHGKFESGTSSAENEFTGFVTGIVLVF